MFKGIRNFISPTRKTNRRNNTTGELLNKEEVLPSNSPRSDLARYGNIYSMLDTDVGLFVDNDPTKIAQVEKCKQPGRDNMTTIQVKQTEEESGWPLVFEDKDKFKEYIETYKDKYNLSEQGRDAADIFREVSIRIAKSVQKEWRGPPTKIYQERIDEKSGMSNKDIIRIRDWVDTKLSHKTGKRLFVMFDYDRTITIIEGGIFFGNSIEELKGYLTHNGFDTEKLTAEGFIEYYVGGPERLRMLQNMFDFLYKNNVKIYIVTNNPACLLERSRGLLDEVLRVLTKNRPLSYLCGASHRGDKYTTIQSEEALRQEVCPSYPRQGGRRSKKTRKQKRKQKKTRKH